MIYCKSLSRQFRRKRRVPFLALRMRHLRRITLDRCQTLVSDSIACTRHRPDNLYKTKAMIARYDCEKGIRDAGERLRERVCNLLRTGGIFNLATGDDIAIEPSLCVIHRAHGETSWNEAERKHWWKKGECACARRPRQLINLQRGSRGTRVRNIPGSWVTWSFPWCSFSRWLRYPIDT